MPRVTVHLIENVLNKAQKQEMIKKLTNTMVETEDENMRQVTWVKIEEVPEERRRDNRGNALTAAMVHQIQKG